MSIDPDQLSSLIHTDPDCVASAAVENEAYIQRDYYEKQIITMQGYLADLTAKQQEWHDKWLAAASKTKACIQKVIDTSLSGGPSV